MRSSSASSMSASRRALRAVIFDRDFTLLECSLPFQRAAAEVCALLGVKAPSLRKTKLAWLFARDEQEYWSNLLGLGERAVLERAEAEFRRRIAGHLARARPMDGAERGLRELRNRGLRLGAVSALPSLEATRSLFSRHGLLQYFDVIVTADLVADDHDIYRAPHEERKEAVVRRALEALGAGAGEAALVGDTDVDVLVAKKLGMLSVAFYGPNCSRLAPLLLAGPDVVIARLDELAGALFGA